MSIINYITELKNGWDKIILSYPNIDSLIAVVENHYKLIENKEDDEYFLRVFPNKENIFRCFSYTSPENTRVILIGQDPYHGENQATGLCFGVNNGCKIPPSLKNINKELRDDIGTEITDCTLEKWAQQGVLMLNSALTVQEHTPASHIKIWSEFTEYILHYINEHTNDKIFVLWGAFAYTRMFNTKFTLDIVKHRIIVSSHPSPLGARRKFQIYPAFLGSKPFSKANNFSRYAQKSL